MHLSHLIIMLAIGLAAGYGLLILASKQEDSLKAIGKFLAWVLIVATLIVAMFDTYFSIKFIKMIKNGPKFRMIPGHECPMFGPGGMPSMDRRGGSVMEPPMRPDMERPRRHQRPAVMPPAHKYDMERPDTPEKPVMPTDGQEPENDD